IIFVNDGSPDNSEEICLRYKEQFPNNVKYIRQENAGVSAARNRGMKEVEGKYISFLDSDDKLSPNTLEEVYAFFEQHYDEIDVVAIPLKFFDARTGDHMLNYKFSRTRVIDVTKEYESIQMHVSSAFVKTLSINSNSGFDTELKIGEDAKFITELILEKNKYGVVVSPVYYYRKRPTRNSAIDSVTTNKEWYTATPKGFNKYLLDYAKKKFGGVPAYVQYVVMYELQWRFKMATQTVLAKNEEAKYKTELFELLAYIDDRIIVGQKHIPLSTKLFVLSKKYKKETEALLERKGSKYYIQDTFIYDVRKEQAAVHIETLQFKEDNVVLEGFYDTPISAGIKLQFFVGEKAFSAEPAPYPWREDKFLGECIFSHGCYKVVLPIQYGNRLNAAISDGQFTQKLVLTLHRFSYLNRFSNSTYRILDRYMILRRRNDLIFEKYTALRRIPKEVRYMAGLLKRLKLGMVLQQARKIKNRDLRIVQPGNRPSSFSQLIEEVRWIFIPLKSLAANFYSITVRLIYFIVKPLYRHPIWLISDRVNAAGDNGEALFRYIHTRTKIPAKVYFAVSKKSPDYIRMKKYGKVINRDSFYYKLLFLLSNKVISSHADDFVVNPFQGRVWDFIDLYKFDFVFLQHGVIHNDLSSWLKRYNKNIKIFVTSAKPEYKAVLGPQYAYSKDVVKLTGLPRFDLLKSMPKQKLIVAPTWRNYLTSDANGTKGLRKYNPEFKLSDYFKFYQKLINDKSLNKALKDTGMTAEFYLHPSLSAQTKDFSSEIFHIKKLPYDYNTAFTEGNILVTDYSSVAFDFAYLKKPVIYTQFDKDEFYQQHSWQPGYFSYEKNGFGPVVYGYEDSIKEIILSINSNSEMKAKYIKRVEDFFYKFDHSNAKRVYEAILNAD
ncbi:MAG TPA: CDP-glycerol glycerophosphotransferase family protein, partial [Candidatus Babeliaceae bacterium]|nr:CDP-glycerol glycerophosphotransferase family protein [Candidatus Babeliaceae bacterium]